MNPAQKILVFMLRAYQRVLSPALMAVGGPMGRCRFEPSCSHYAVEAIQKRGALRGAFLAFWRVCRCNPWGGSGFDPVPDQKFRKINPAIAHPATSDLCGHRHN